METQTQGEGPNRDLEQLKGALQTIKARPRRRKVQYEIRTFSRRFILVFWGVCLAALLFCTVLPWMLVVEETSGGRRVAGVSLTGLLSFAMDTNAKGLTVSILAYFLSLAVSAALWVGGFWALPSHHLRAIPMMACLLAAMCVSGGVLSETLGIGLRASAGIAGFAMATLGYRWRVPINSDKPGQG